MDNLYFQLLVILSSFLCSLLIVGRLRRLALSRSFFDIPNQRSSHKLPIPKGGGAVFAILLSVTILLISLFSPTQISFLLVIGIAVTSISYLGWLDDRYDISSMVRLPVQFSVAGLVIYYFGPFNYIQYGTTIIENTFLLAVLSCLWLVWMINLYNFMDGIDGIATGQTIVAGATLNIWFIYNGDIEFGLICLIVASIGLGFLVWNWSPAKIFLGDVGSTTLGMFFGLSALVGVNQHNIPLGAFVLLLGVFIGDATFTLLGRILRGENIAEAHRAHLYQRLVRMGYSHGQVSASVIIICLFLAVLATMVALDFGPLWVWYMLGGVILLISTTVILFKERVHIWR